MLSGQTIGFVLNYHAVNCSSRLTLRKTRSPAVAKEADHTAYDVSDISLSGRESHHEHVARLFQTTHCSTSVLATAGLLLSFIAFIAAVYIETKTDFVSAHKNINMNSFRPTP